MEAEIQLGFVLSVILHLWPINGSNPDSLMGLWVTQVLGFVKTDMCSSLYKS